MPYVAASDGAQIYYKDWGSGPPVVLIHGWPLDGASWDAQAVFLAGQGLRVIAHDRRGFGRSDHPWTGYDYDTMADDLGAVLDHLDVTGATLVGFSMGGGEVARYIARHGAARVAKAVFVAAVTPFMLKTDDNPEGVDASVFDGMYEGVLKDRAQFMKGFFPSFFGNSLLHHAASDGLLEFSLFMALHASHKATLDCIRAFSATDFRGDLAKASVPALVIHGTSDQTVPIDVSGRRTAKLLPNATLIEYEGAPHGLTATHADRLNGDLLSFVRGA